MSSPSARDPVEYLCTMRSRYLFFFLFCFFAVPGRFTPIFLSAHSLTPAQLGFIIAVPKLVSLVSIPFICNVADRTHSEHVTVASHVVGLVFFQLQALAFPAFNLIHPSFRFSLLLVLSIGFGFFGSATYPLVYAIAVSQLRFEHGNDAGPLFIGLERLWGAISWAIASLLLGLALDLRTTNMSIVYMGKFIFGILFAISVMLFSQERDKQASSPQDGGNLETLVSGELSETEHDCLETPSNSSYATFNAPPDEQNSQSMSPFSALSEIFSKDLLPTVMFLNLLFWVSAGMSLVESLLFIFLQQDLRASNLVCGLSVVITVIFEVPLFAVTPFLLRRFGAPGLAIFGCLCYIVRAFAYTLVPNAWALLLFEPLHGVTYAAVSTAAVAFIAERVPQRLEATGQAVLSNTKAFAAAFGTAAGGYVIERFGSKVLYRGAGIVVLSATVAYGLVDRTRRRNLERNNGRVQQKVRP
eukprot:GFKZ01004826.1.p1 GENE.GFKZ01004826.1~~GFKZ01004826.1.p1  ORF type:complete len:471 (+),score=33.52 GFKZ01004826.1:182-1594(+)